MAASLVRSGFCLSLYRTRRALRIGPEKKVHGLGCPWLPRNKFGQIEQGIPRERGFPWRHFPYQTWSSAFRGNPPVSLVPPVSLLVGFPDKQGFFHYTPEHCLINGGFPAFWWKKMFQMGKTYLLRSTDKSGIHSCLLDFGVGSKASPCGKTTLLCSASSAIVTPPSP